MKKRNRKRLGRWIRRISLFATVIVAGIYYLALPAEITIDNQKFELPITNGELLVGNMRGDTHGINRDPVSNVSLVFGEEDYMCEKEDGDNDYSVGRSHMFSIFTAHALSEMRPERAYAIAQKSIDDSEFGDCSLISPLTTSSDWWKTHRPSHFKPEYATLHVR